jgi:anti-sigma B factor antagonist
MAIAIEELTGGITKVTLDGRLDAEGAAAVDLKMNAIAGTRKTVLVDLQQVSFLGSVGLRALVIPARDIKARGGKMVFFGPTKMVEKVLKISGADTMVPVHHELQSALAALQES